MFKRGSLSLSVNAIVVLILAVTMLGLALAFINMVFNQANDLTTGQIDKIRENELTAFMDRCSDDYCLEKSNLKLKKNDQEDIFLVINNKFDCDLDEATITIGDEPGGSKNFGEETCHTIGGDGSCNDIQIISEESKFVEAKRKDWVTIRTIVKNTAANTIYTYDVVVTGECFVPGQTEPFKFAKKKTLQVDVTG